MITPPSDFGLQAWSRNRLWISLQRWYFPNASLYSQTKKLPNTLQLVIVGHIHVIWTTSSKHLSFSISFDGTTEIFLLISTDDIWTKGYSTYFPLSNTSLYEHLSNLYGYVFLGISWHLKYYYHNKIKKNTWYTFFLYYFPHAVSLKTSYQIELKNLPLYQVSDFCF